MRSFRSIAESEDDIHRHYPKEDLYADLHRHLTTEMGMRQRKAMPDDHDDGYSTKTAGWETSYGTNHDGDTAHDHLNHHAVQMGFKIHWSRPIPNYINRETGEYHYAIPDGAHERNFDTEMVGKTSRLIHPNGMHLENTHDDGRHRVFLTDYKRL
jgi:hypothetical protein